MSVFIISELEQVLLHKSVDESAYNPPVHLLTQYFKVGWPNVPGHVTTQLKLELSANVDEGHFYASTHNWFILSL